MYAQYLPIYTPSEEEKRDPALFASNVRDIMAKSVSTSNLMIQIILLLNAWHVILIFVFYTFFFSFRALRLPTVDYSFEDCQLSMVKGPLCLPSHTCLLEFSRLVRNLGWVPLETFYKDFSLLLFGFNKHDTIAEKVDSAWRLGSLCIAHGSWVNSADDHITSSSLLQGRACPSPFIPSIHVFNDSRLNSVFLIETK